MVKIVRIGGAGGFLGDSSVAAPQLLKGGRLDYMVLDYLAEATMSSLGRHKAARPDQGFARDFTESPLGKSHCIVMDRSRREIDAKRRAEAETCKSDS
jgi:hypothetical protein